MYLLEDGPRVWDVLFLFILAGVSDSWNRMAAILHSINMVSKNLTYLHKVHAMIA